jgi:hypothetical protein
MERCNQNIMIDSFFYTMSLNYAHPAVAWMPVTMPDLYLQLIRDLIFIEVGESMYAELATTRA